MRTIDINSITLIATAVCTLMGIIQLYYFLILYSRVLRHSKKQNMLPENNNCPPVSVVMVTKNSSSYLKENLTAILEQNYPEFEVIVVNDELTGEDEDAIKLIENKYTHLYHTFIPKTARYVSRKKLGIAMGIKASKYDWIVVTEPYCKPDSPYWLRSLARYFTDGTDIVLGYCNFSSEGKDSMFSRHIKADTLLSYMRFLGQALGKKPYMGIGKNMAYRKEIYREHKGFSNQLTLLRGEDDLFVNEIANNNNTKVVVSKDSIMRMPVPKYKRIWKGEKLSYEVTGNHYKGFGRFVNAIETWSLILFNLSLIIAICFSIIGREWLFTAIALIMWLGRFTAAMTVFRKTSKAMGENLCCYFPIFDFMRPLYSLNLKLSYISRKKSDFTRK